MPKLPLQMIPNMSFIMIFLSVDNPSTERKGIAAKYLTLLNITFENKDGAVI